MAGPFGPSITFYISTLDPQLGQYLKLSFVLFVAFITSNKSTLQDEHIADLPRFLIYQSVVIVRIIIKTESIAAFSGVFIGANLHPTTQIIRKLPIAAIACFLMELEYSILAIVNLRNITFLINGARLLARPV